MNRRALGKWLQEKREAAGLTQAQVSARLGYQVGGALVSWENGRNPIPVWRLFDLAEIYELELPEIKGALAQWDPKKLLEWDRLEARFTVYLMGSLRHAIDDRLGATRVDIKQDRESTNYILSDILKTLQALPELRRNIQQITTERHGRGPPDL